MPQFWDVGLCCLQLSADSDPFACMPQACAHAAASPVTATYLNADNKWKQWAQTTSIYPIKVWCYDILFGSVLFATEYIFFFKFSTCLISYTHFFFFKRFRCSGWVQRDTELVTSDHCDKIMGYNISKSVCPVWFCFVFFFFTFISCFLYQVRGKYERRTFALVTQIII